MARAIPQLRLNTEATAAVRRRAADARVPVATAASILVLRGDASFRLADAIAALLDKRLQQIASDVADMRAALLAMQAPAPAPPAQEKKKHDGGRYAGLPDAIRKQFEEADRAKGVQK